MPRSNATNTLRQQGYRTGRMTGDPAAQRAGMSPVGRAQMVVDRKAKPARFGSTAAREFGGF
ncbi:MAG: hypothetical protein CL927_08995 [Deltaproteobacteria bacterium]|nr:hypothetical protein [Deltaproteobacteria bacterium]HCH66889.1 hypothetical protein [Deltaproteobacteria bacterium]